MNGASAEARLLELHDRFCAGFTDRRPELVLEAVADSPELVVVTSEDSLLRGTDELRAFLERYVAGPTAYSWTWDRRDTVASESWGRLLAVGTEAASSGTEQLLTPYRMTVIRERTNNGWALVQVHGSSPHHA